MAILSHWVASSERTWMSLSPTTFRSFLKIILPSWRGSTPCTTSMWANSEHPSPRSRETNRVYTERSKFIVGLADWTGWFGFSRKATFLSLKSLPLNLRRGTPTLSFCWGLLPYTSKNDKNYKRLSIWLHGLKCWNNPIHPKTRTNSSNIRPAAKTSPGMRKQTHGKSGLREIPTLLAEKKLDIQTLKLRKFLWIPITYYKKTHTHGSYLEVIFLFGGGKK